MAIGNNSSDHFSSELLLSKEITQGRTVIKSFFKEPPLKVKITPAFIAFLERITISGAEAVVPTGTTLKSFLIKRISDNSPAFNDLQIATAMNRAENGIYDTAVESDQVNIRILLGGVIFALNDFALYQKRRVTKPYLSNGINNTFGWIKEKSDIFHILIQPLNISDGSVKIDYVKSCERYTQERVHTIHL